MRYKSSDYAKTLYAILKESTDHKASIKAFVKTLERHGRLSLYRKIVSDFIRVTNLEDGIKEIEVTSAKPISKETLAHAFGAKNDIEAKVDSSLVSGMKIRVDDDFVDNSIKARLADVRNAFSK